MVGRLLFDPDLFMTTKFLSSSFVTTQFAWYRPRPRDGWPSRRTRARITIDVAYRYFRTPKRHFIVADVPGHEQFTRNMATGHRDRTCASWSVDASKGVLVSDAPSCGHRIVIGYSNIILAVNKMDLIDYREDGFEALADEFRRAISLLGFDQISIIPVSALRGDKRSRKK